MKSLLIGFALAVALAGAGYTFVRTAEPHAAQARVEVTENCSWTEVKICQGGGNNHCCPNDK